MTTGWSLEFTAYERVVVGDLQQLGDRIIAAVGHGGATELLDAITRPEADRAALIGRLSSRDDAQWLAEVL